MAHPVCGCENPEALAEAVLHASDRLAIIVHFLLGDPDRGIKLAVSVTRASRRPDGVFLFEGRSNERGASVTGEYDLVRRVGRLTIDTGSFSMPPAQAP